MVKNNGIDHIYIPINRLAAVETDIDLASCLMCESHAMQRGHGGSAAGLAGGSGDWLVARQLGLAGGSGPCRTGNPLEPPPLKPLSSGERLRGSSLGPCPTRSALEPPRSAPDEGGGGERLGGSSLGPCRAGKAWNCFCTLKIIKPSLFSSGSALGAQNNLKKDQF